jgi:Nucleotidyl transferase AbiEii toxin, Type IV TA system
MKPEGLIESIRQRLLNLSRENGEAFDFVLARYGVERFLHRLSLSAHAGEFVLKGSMLFHVWNRRMHRPTRDLDLLGAGPANVESVRGAILDVLRTDAPDDGLVFEEATLVVAPIREETTDGGVRAKFRAKLGNVRIPVQVDVGFGDAVVPAPEMREFTSLLSDLPGTSMPSYPVCTVIAEKFEALIRLDEQNTRMKDFFDLELLLRTDPPERELLWNAIRATFERRGSEIPTGIPNGLTDRFASEKQVMWNAFLRKNGLEVVGFPEVVAAIRGKLEWIREDRSNGFRKG